MVNHLRILLAAGSVAVVVSLATAQQAGSIRGVVIDADFDVPLPFAEVRISETGAVATASADGNFVFGEVPAGRYTLVFSKEGFTRQIRPEVVVTAGGLTEVDASLTGDFLELDTFVVQELRVGGGSEAALLQLRLESPALVDSIGSDLIRLSGATDAAAALRLIPGATVIDGFAVIRGLPDRYVSSQLNGSRLPTADADKRGVELDQFQNSVIESIQVSKTFTPDQQGDASGGAVNLVLKSIPEETYIRVSARAGYNTQTTGRRDFLTYEGGGMTYWGNALGAGQPQVPGTNWTGAVGVSEGEAPLNQRWTVEAGGRWESDGVTVGGLTSFYYENDFDFYDNGVNDSLWVTSPGAAPTPQQVQAQGPDDFKTALFDVTKGAELVRWGWLGTAAIEFENNSIGVTYLYTRTATDVATLAEDTRGKEFYFPGYDVDDIDDPGNASENRFFAPYVRTETLEYTDRTTSSLIINGDHTLPLEDLWIGDHFAFKAPILDWAVTIASASEDKPDTRRFGSFYTPPSLNPGFPPFVPPFLIPEQQFPFKPAALFLLGNLQRTWQTIDEDTTQYAVNLLLPFEQWSGDEGFVKFGVFGDSLSRRFTQQSYSNFNQPGITFDGGWDEFWSAEFPEGDHPITDGPPFVDVDYNGSQEIFAWYGMADLPLDSWIKLIGGARVESVKLGIVNIPEEDATWYPPGSVAVTALNPGDADVDLDEQYVLPSIGFEVSPIENLYLRGSYAQTIALPTFKELTPILQQEFLGGDVFIGNPNLRISEIQNYDLRIDFVPTTGSLFSASWFYKSITNPIERVQRLAVGFSYTTAVNFPEGTIQGWELEARQDFGAIHESLTGFSLGANATIIDSQVTLSAEEAAIFAQPNIAVPITSRPMTDAPDYLYNLFATYEVPDLGTQFGLFYTVTGNILLAGAGESDGNFVPSVYQKPFGTLNFTLTQPIGEHFQLTFQAKNLTNPVFREVYAGPGISGEFTRKSFSTGIDLSLTLAARFTF